MQNSLALHRRLDSASANDNQCSLEQSADITHRVHVFMTVLCIPGILVTVSWLFLMMAMPETQPESAIFLDR